MSNLTGKKFNLFLNFLSHRLNKPLPGLNAHLKFAPKVDGELFRNFKPDPDAKSSAVLIILSENIEKNEIDIYFTLRSASLKNHSGQISFPGGRKEFGESDNETALRETFEEIGIKSEELKIIGKLSNLYVPPSKSVISPVIACLIGEPKIIINEAEVEEVFKFSLETLSDIRNLSIEKWQFQGQEVEIPLWRLHPTTPLWGATAIILSELLELFHEFLDSEKKK